MNKLRECIKKLWLGLVEDTGEKCRKLLAGQRDGNRYNRSSIELFILGIEFWTGIILLEMVSNN